MANNNSITYWNSVKNTYSDSLPNPDVVTGAIFNDMNGGLLEMKWRNSIQRTWKNSEIYTAYGSTVPSGYILMHECVDITFNDMSSASDQRRHIVRFHLQKGRDEQIVTYRSNYDSVSGVSVIHIDWGSDLFPIAVQTGSQVGGANNKLKIEFQATSNNADEFSYWIETNAPCTTIFDGKNTARNSSSNSSWNNLSYILDNDLGHRQGTFSDVYKNNTFGYQREYYNLGSTTWKLQTGTNSYTNAKIYGDTSYGSVLEVSRVITNLATVNTVNAVNLNVTGSTSIANVTNDNIYVSNIYAKTTGGSFNIRDTVNIMDGALIFGDVSHLGNYTMSGLLTANSGLDITGISTFRDTIKIMAGSSVWTDRIEAYSLANIITMASDVNINGKLDVSGTSISNKQRSDTVTTYSGNATPTSLATSRVNISGNMTLDLRSCANTAGDIYYVCGRTSSGFNPKIIFNRGPGISSTDATITIDHGVFYILIGSGTTGVFYYNGPLIAA